MGCLDNLRKCDAVCCRTFFIVLDNIDEDLRLYFELHGVEVVNNVLRFVMPCKMLNKRTLRCLINENKPKICKEFPKEDSHTPENCFYYKKKIEKV